MSEVMILGWVVWWCQETFKPGEFTSPSYFTGGLGTLPNTEREIGERRAAGVGLAERASTCCEFRYSIYHTGAAQSLKKI